MCLADTNCPAETQSRDFGHLTTQNNSKRTEDTQAIRQISPLSTSIEATPVESSQDQNKSIIGEDVLHCMSIEALGRIML